MSQDRQQDYRNAYIEVSPFARPGSTGDLCAPASAPPLELLTKNMESSVDTTVRIAGELRSIADRLFGCVPEEASAVGPVPTPLGSIEILFGIARTQSGALREVEQQVGRLRALAP